MKTNVVTRSLFGVTSVLVLTTQVFACSLPINEKFIQGTWRGAGDQGQGHSWFLEWTFKQGTFKQLGYPPIFQEGRYRVLSAKDNQIELELFDQNGTFGDKPRQIKILLNKTNKSIVFDSITLYFSNSVK